MTTPSQNRPDETDPAAVRLDFDAHAPAFSNALAHLDHAATKELDRVAFDARLRELVRVRASQLNGCAYCVDMHTKDARAIGESDERLAALPVWRESPVFDRRERAALALCEAITLTAIDPVSVEVWNQAAAEYSEDELGAVVSLITVINAWNAIGVSTRTWRPGSYQP